MIIRDQMAQDLLGKKIIHRYFLYWSTRLLTNTTDMLDSASQAWLVTWERAGEFHAGRDYTTPFVHNPDFKAFAFTCALSATRDIRRENMVESKRVCIYSNTQPHKKIEEQALNIPGDQKDNPYRQAVQNEAIEALRDQLQKLPYEHREVIGKVYFEGKRYKPAAKDLGMDIGTFKMRLFRAKKTLRTRLTQYT